MNMYEKMHEGMNMYEKMHEGSKWPKQWPHNWWLCLSPVDNFDLRIVLERRGWWYPM